MTNDKQTAEEAAREYGTLYYFDKDGNRKKAGINPIKEQSFLAGVKWAQEREKVLGEYWVLLKPGNVEHPVGTCMYSTEEGARGVASVEILGHVPIKVKLVEVESDER
jgi:hypothetical protein